MAAREITSCVDPVNFGPDLSFTHYAFSSYVALTTFIGLIAAGVLANLTLVGLATTITAYTLVILIGMLVILIIFLIWWLLGRLICLGQDQCVIGVNMGPPTSQPGKKGGDDDATINLLLAPGPLAIADEKVDFIPKEDYWSQVQGHFMKEQPAILQIGRKYVDDAEHVRNYLKHLHCEFEGSGIRNVLAWASVVVVLLSAALAALLLLPFPANVIVLAILSLLAVLVGLFAGLSAFDVGDFHPLNPGDPGDVNPNFRELIRGDVVFIKGRWIYDSLHEGWNEFHAVHAGSIVGRMETITDANGDDVEFVAWPSDIGGGLGLDTPDKVQAAVAAWCAAQQGADDGEDGGSREDPSQNWIIHPLVDGCQNVIIT